MFKLINMTSVIPKSLFLAQVEIEADRGLTAMGGFAAVFTGKYAGQQVALKILDPGRYRKVDEHRSQLHVTKLIAQNSL